MKILAPTHPMLHGGGIATIVRGLVPALSRVAADGDEVIVANPPVGSADGALASIGRARGGLARLRYEQIVLPRRAREADTVHLFDARAPLASSKPFVLTVHDVSYLDHADWFGRGAARYKATMLSASLRRRPAAVICDSYATRRDLLRHYPGLPKKTRVEVIVPGLESAPATSIDSSPDEPYMLTVATIEPRKNHLNLLRAFQVAQREGLGLRWKVVGADGHWAQVIRPALEAAEGVEVLGRVPADELERLYAGATLLAAPSLLEGFGYPPLEAMARGIPVIASAGGVFDETLGEDAVRVRATDVEGWAAALVDLAWDGALRARLVERGRARITALSWEDYAQKVWELHQDAAARA